jgi:hypothetical protein
VKFLIVPLLLLIIIKSYSQDSIPEKLNKNLQFGRHLVNTQQFSEANFFLRNALKEFTDLDYQDELNYLIGWNYYHQKMLIESSNFLLKVSSSSDRYYKSQFFTSYNYTYQNQLVLASDILNSLSLNSNNLNELKSFQLAGIYLLDRDLESFIKYSEDFSLEYFPLAKEEQNLLNYYQSIKSYKSKKPGMAALFSTLIPGSGKIYAGRTGDGVSSFLIVTSLGLISFENYYQSGLKDPKTIFFGSVFSLFYVGNIWGSYFSVKMQNEEFNHEMDHKILFDLHIPLRTIFN